MHVGSCRYQGFHSIHWYLSMIERLFDDISHSIPCMPVTSTLEWASYPNYCWETTWSFLSGGDTIKVNTPLPSERLVWWILAPHNLKWYLPIFIDLYYWCGTPFHQKWKRIFSILILVTHTRYGRENIVDYLLLPWKDPVVVIAWIVRDRQYPHVESVLPHHCT